MYEFVSGLIMDGYAPVFVSLFEFLPTVIALLFVVSFFERSGWVLSFGCTTLASTKCDLTTLRFLTFVPCTAKLPVLIFLCGLLLSWGLFGVVFLYIFAIFIGLLLGGNAILQMPRIRRWKFKPFISEFAENIFNFLKRVSFGLIMAVTILYLLQYWGLLIPLTELIAPIFVPIGLSNVALVTALLFGVVGKEMIIGVILSFGVASIGFTTASLMSFIIFVLLYTPCVPTLTAIKARFGWAVATKTACFNFAVAYVCAFVVYMACVLLI